ncbi:MAG: V-type ATP synthase subunit I [Promethearchaeota archaeon]
MVKKDEFCLMRAEINQNYKDQFIMELSNMNAVHIKSKKKSKYEKGSEEKDPFREKIKDLRKNLNNLFKKLEISEYDLQNLKTKKNEKVEFVTQDFHELINSLLEEIDFYTNRAIELNTYISKGKIEVDNLNSIKVSYKFLKKINLNTENLQKLRHFYLRVFTTFSKNLTNLQNLFDFSEFPNVYETFQISDDRICFYIIYPKDKQDEFNGRIRLIHSEEVPILKKYLTSEGINFLRIDKEINFIENLISRYKKEQNRITKENLLKFAGINEIVQNIEEYNWVEQQFEKLPSNRLFLKFFIPLSKKEEVKQKLFDIFKENISIEAQDVSKGRPSYESLPEKEKLIKKIGKPIIKESIEETESNKKDEGKEDLRENTPTIMKNFFLVRPFETITKMYGIPTYSEIDPTPIIAITFPLLFGLMFGDIGHGLILIIAGFIGTRVLKNKSKNAINISWIIFLCGWASVLIGFLYGEFFGKHEIEIFGTVYFHLEPVTIPFLNITLYNPLGNILSVFYFAIYIGVFHITLGWIIQFLNYWKQHRKYLAFSDSFIKILLLIGGTILIFGFGFDIYGWLKFPYPILLVLIPALLLWFLKPVGKILKISYLKSESYTGLLGEGSIETFDTFLSVMSNVASYIRILALALAHIALLYAINAMSTLIQGENIGVQIINIIGSVFGNIVIILLEGLLAFINAIRLHFYEFFFKFYRGGGIEYFPFYLDNNYSNIKFKRVAEKDIISEEIEKEFEMKTIKEEIDKAKNYLTQRFE